MSGRVSTSRCVAPDDRGIAPCEAQPIPGAPFPLCVHHLAEAWKFASQRMTKARAGRIEPEQRHLPPPADLIAAAQAAEPSRPGIVYYLRVGELIKIGVTWDLDRRLREYPPDIEAEAARLTQFQRYAVARREWFTPADELMAHIASLNNAQEVVVMAEKKSSGGRSGGKKPGAKAGTAAAKKGSAAGGRASTPPNKGSGSKS